MAILDDVKSSLGIRTQQKDADISDTINSAKKLLRLHGVNVINDTDPHTAQLIKLYCRGWYNYQGNGEQYMHAFRMAADQMALSLDYKEVAE